MPEKGDIKENGVGVVTHKAEMVVCGVTFYQIVTNHTVMRLHLTLVSGLHGPAFKAGR